ncbi:MAG: HAMP domain-containing protein [Rhizobiales bacterium]|nr:HAMP domain-containing protein [Hyphomicrobiales bacterium]
MTLPKLSIAAKLYAIFALLATATVILALVAVVNARRHAALTEEFVAANQGAQNVERINGLIYAVRMEARGIQLAADPSAAKTSTIATELIRHNDRIGDIVTEWQWSTKPGDAEQFATLSDRIKQFQELNRELVSRASAGGVDAVRALGDSETNREVLAALSKDLQAFGQLYSHRAKRAYAEIDAGIERTAWMTSLLGGFAVLLASIGAFLIWRAVARPLAEITRVTEQVAGGDATVTIPFIDRGDEIGALARSIGVFQQAMRHNEELNRTVVDDADTRARRQEQMSNEIARFSADVEATLAELGRISDQMLAASSQLASAADDASAKTARAEAASSEASANVRDIASAADELSASVNEIDRQVAQSNAIANKAVSEAGRTNLAVKELDEAAGRIGDVIKLITDIAEQTNLLALNATIEAARAGEAGRGFAVVAGEVKALAGQTSRATEEIGAQIAGMQRATVRSIEAITAIEHTIREIGNISGAIAAAVTEQGAATAEIARSVETAAKRTVETANEVNLVGTATHDTRASAGAVKSVADNLGSVAGRIRGQVDQFFERLSA